MLRTGVSALALGTVVSVLLLSGAAATASATTRTAFGVNLVKDPGFELATGGNGTAQHAMPHWISSVPEFTATSYGTANFPTKKESKRIAGGKVFASCGNGVASNDLLQRVPLHGLNGLIDAGRVRATISVMEATFAADNDTARASLSALTAGQLASVLDAVTSGDLAHTNTRVQLKTDLVLPPDTRQLGIDLHGERLSGNYCDAYFDNVSVSLTKLP